MTTRSEEDSLICRLLHEILKITFPESVKIIHNMSNNLSEYVKKIHNMSNNLFSEQHPKQKQKNHRAGSMLNCIPQLLPDGYGDEMTLNIV